MNQRLRRSPPDVVYTPIDVTSSVSEKQTIIEVQSYESKGEEDMATVKDVVCGMDIDPNTATAQMKYQGKTYHFCSNDCHAKFMAESQKYAS